MAQTKTKPKAKRAKPKQAKRATSTKPKPNRAKAKPKTDSSNGVGHVTADAATKARIPLAVGGAALVGAASGVVFGAARSGNKVLGVRLPHPKRVQIRSKDLTKAAKEVGSFGDQIGDLTAELKSFRNGLGEGTHNSPLEVILKGLTARR